MKPCTHEQDVLLALHGELSAAGRLKASLHCAFCPSCRERRRQFEQLGAALMTLRPHTASAGATLSMGGYHSRKLAIVLAALAVMAAATSYYYTVFASEPRAVYGDPGATAVVNVDDCGTGAMPPPEKKVQRRELAKTKGIGKAKGSRTGVSK